MTVAIGPQGEPLLEEIRSELHGGLTVREAIRGALNLLSDVGGLEDWNVAIVQFDNPTRRGACDFSGRTINIAESMLSNPDEFWEAVRHEIAHCQTQAEAEDHGEQWRLALERIPERPTSNRDFKIDLHDDEEKDVRDVSVDGPGFGPVSVTCPCGRRLRINIKAQPDLSAQPGATPVPE